MKAVPSIILLEILTASALQAGPYSLAVDDPSNTSDAPFPGFLGPHGDGKARIDDGSAQMAKSMNNLRQLVLANQAYASNNGRYCPADNRYNTMRWCAKKSGSKWDRTQGYLSDYLGKSHSVGVCPLSKASSQGSFELGTGGYGYNAAYVRGLPSWEWTQDDTNSRDSARLGSIHRSSTVMFTTFGYANGNGIQEDPFCEPPFRDLGNGPTEWCPSPSVHFRYNNKALVAWFDGQVTAESCEPREVGFNPHGGDASQQKLGWFGPDDQNGFWNPEAKPTYAHTDP